jgi:lipopolysaccharide/colanic/teichoic acid biosynthesis glycosyltransferase
MTVDSSVTHKPLRQPTDAPPRTKPKVRAHSLVALRPSWYGVFSRIINIVLAALLLLLTSPLLLLSAILVKLTSRGPVLYWQTRLGLFGKPFTIYKLRSMYYECERDSGVRWSTPGDNRITPVGRFLRRTHLDELPQLWNVLRGDMSLAGPRPERPEFVPKLEQVIPRYRDRLLVPPGVTGLAQVQLPPDVDLASVRIKLAYDLYYARNRGFWLDLRIVLATVGKILHVPHHISRRLLGFPHRDTIEQFYERLVAASPDEPEA